MEAQRFSIGSEELGVRMRKRLADIRNPNARKAIWQQNGHRVLIHADRLQLRIVNGWLLVGLELESDQTQRQNLQVVFHLGSPDDGDGPQAAASINAATEPAAQLADLWGPDLQRVLWDTVLDAVEVSLNSASQAPTGAPSKPVSLLGFHAVDGAIQVDVLIGAI